MISIKSNQNFLANIKKQHHNNKNTLIIIQWIIFISPFLRCLENPRLPPIEFPKKRWHKLPSWWRWWWWDWWWRPWRKPLQRLWWCSGTWEVIRYLGGDSACMRTACLNQGRTIFPPFKWLNLFKMSQMLKSKRAPTPPQWVLNRRSRNRRRVCPAIFLQSGFSGNLLILHWKYIEERFVVITIVIIPIILHWRYPTWVSTYPWEEKAGCSWTMVTTPEDFCFLWFLGWSL